jgi:large subunit ribosomal protein L21
MFAVLKTGGKQYKVAAGDTLRVEKLAAQPGDAIQFNEVLMVGDQVGTPLVAGAAVQAPVIDQVKGEKLIHFVRRRRKHSSKRTKGHRQSLTLVRVTDILASGGDATGVMAAVGAGFREASAQQQAPARAGLLGSARQAAATVRDGAETVLDRAGSAAGKAVDVVTDAVEDVTESRAGQVALAAAAVAGVAAVAAAVLRPGAAQADDEAPDAPDADEKE